MTENILEKKLKVERIILAKVERSKLLELIQSKGAYLAQLANSVNCGSYSVEVAQNLFLNMGE